jgi:translation initiation factor IF-2
MQQRRLRLGDILDDYCPRERRITNHAVVAMIEDQVKQTRCTTCDADHEYKAARVPPPRRKRGDAIGGPPEGILRPRAAAEDADPVEEVIATDGLIEDPAPEPDTELQAPVENVDADSDTVPMAAGAEEDGPVHRRLIRATLPRPEGQSPERKEPDFTVRQPGGRGGREFDGNNNNGGSRFGQGRRPMRAQGGGGGGSQQRFGGPRPGPGGPRTGSGQGRPGGANRPGHPGGPRGNRPGQGAGRPGGGGGRKRGR